MGYDTVNQWLPIERVGVNDLLSHISPKLTHYTECNKENDFYVTGNFNNYLVYASSKGISLKGSLSKWYLGDNIQELSRGDTKRAIEKLSDELYLPFSEAKVKRVDFGFAFPMNQQPMLYYSKLGRLRHFNRFEQPKSIYYSNSSKSLIFYDKIAECKANRTPINHIFLNQNLLRYEIKFIRRLDQIFNQAEIKVSDLYNEDFYMNIIDEWVNQFQRITKIRKIRFRDDVMMLPKEIVEQFALMYIHQVGYEDALQMVEEMKKRGQFEHVKYAARAKQMIRELCNKPILTEPSELIEELDSKIKKVQRNYR